MSSGSINRWIVRQWRKRTVLGTLLLVPVSWLFRVFVALRRAAYRHEWCKTEHLSVPVIIVGNLTVGGSGKTPLVMHLVERLHAMGWRPGVVSRGYGGADHRPRRVDPAPYPDDCGDEPALVALRCRCPVAVGGDRVAAARLLVSDCDVVIADDGLQHYPLGRDVEIAVIDGDMGLGNGRPLPAGPLREPAYRLREVDFVAVRDGDGSADIPGALRQRAEIHGFRVTAGASRQLVEPESTRPLPDWTGVSVHAVAGIGVPERFFGQLDDLGIDLERHAFADHHRFTPTDLAFGDDAPILMTEKDAIKCRSFADERVWVVPVNVEDTTGLVTAVSARLASWYQPAEKANGPTTA